MISQFLNGERSRIIKRVSPFLLIAALGGFTVYEAGVNFQVCIDRKTEDIATGRRLRRPGSTGEITAEESRKIRAGCIRDSWHLIGQ